MVTRRNFIVSSLALGSAWQALAGTARAASAIRFGYASITWDGNRVTLTDLTSSNGTFLRLDGPHPLKHGDHLRMGDQLFRVELRR